MAPYYRVMLHFKRLHCTVYTREVASPGRGRTMAAAGGRAETPGKIRGRVI